MREHPVVSSCHGNEPSSTIVPGHQRRYSESASDYGLAAGYHGHHRMAMVLERLD
jgi:hypothetical protein